MKFNVHKITDLPAMRVTAGHEFFHFVQYLYDTRLPYAKNFPTSYSKSLNWLNEAAAVWAEEKFSGSNPDYVSPIRHGHEMAPFSGMEAGSKGSWSLTSSAHHGYGMSAFIKYLVENFGESIVLSIYENISQEQHPHPVQAIEQSLQSLPIPTTLSAEWELFLREYVTGAIYNMNSTQFVVQRSGTLQFRSDADKEASFTKSYPDLSARLFLVKLDDPDIMPAKAIKLTIDQDQCEITLFKFRLTDEFAQFLSYSFTKQLTQKGLRALTDDGYDLLVMVTNPNYAAPYTNTKQITLDIVIDSIAAAMTLSANPPAVAADGTSTSTITATVTDDEGNPVEGETVFFTTDHGGLSPTRADTDATGVASVVYTAPDYQPAGGTATVTGGTLYDVTASCMITINPAPSPPWPGWPAPQWCPMTGGPAGFYDIIYYPGGCPDLVECWYHRNNGSLSHEWPFCGGSINGMEKEYYESGELENEMPWENGERNGVQKWYYKSGQLGAEIPWVDDEYHGTAYHYRENGLLYWEVSYQNDLKHGEEKRYDPDGNMTHCSIYENGTYVGSCMPE